MYITVHYEANTNRDYTSEQEAVLFWENAGMYSFSFFHEITYMEHNM
jgi:hypothetical protein